MKISWLHQQGNQDCLLFFAGWGMCLEPFLEIPPGELDIIIIYDYRNLAGGDFFSFLATLQDKAIYRTFSLMAWSMGVWTASMLFTNAPSPLPKLNSVIAMGGTNYPIHDQQGIPEQKFNEITTQLTPERVYTFQRSMFADKKEADRFITSFSKSERSPQELQQELLDLASAYKNKPDVPDIYTSKIITGRDRIFSARNQLRAWGRANCRTLPLPHFSFYHWPSWSAMIQELA